MRHLLRARNQRGQTLPIVALMLVFLFGIAALTVDGSLNYLDRRVLRAASDAAALSGAGVVSQGNATAQNTAMSYAFLNLGQTLPADAAHTCTADAANPGGLGANQCVISFGGYTITVTTDYNPANPVANPYSPSASVAVDISHAKPQSGFAAVIGTSSVTVGSHSAATSQSGFQSFPYAIATRLLSIKGSVNQFAFGSVLISQCSKGGTGLFKTSSGQNGGIYINGGSNLVLAQSLDSSSGTNVYQSAQAVVSADQTTRLNCTSTPNLNPLTPAAGATDQVTFSQANSHYNAAFGFNTGPTPPGLCADTTGPNFPSPCQDNPVGDGAWQDNTCWTAGAFPIETSSAYFDAADGLIHPSSSPPIAPCANGNGPWPNHGTREGSFKDTEFSKFPPFPDPVGLVQNADTSRAVLSVGQTGGANPGGIPLGSGSISFSTTTWYSSYSGGNQDLKFAPGWYVFDGNFTIAPKTFQCMDTPALSGRPYLGCVFVFRNGASLEVGGNSAAIECSPKIAGHLGCAFQLSDGSGAYATLFAHQSAAVDLTPVVYFPSERDPNGTCGVDGAGNPVFGVCMPIIYSTDNEDCTSSGTCAVDFANLGSNMNVGGTIFIPNGMYAATQNAGPSSGQVVADTIVLQGGSSSFGSAVAYRNSLVAPVPGAPFLFE